jgi:hypothetical protein
MGCRAFLLTKIKTEVEKELVGLFFHATLTWYA